MAASGWAMTREDTKQEGWQCPVLRRGVCPVGAPVRSLSATGVSFYDGGQVRNLFLLRRAALGLLGRPQHRMTPLSKPREGKSAEVESFANVPNNTKEEAS